MRPLRVGPGIKAYSNAKCRVIECQYSARPDRDSAWARAERRKVGAVAFARSYGLSWDTPAGKPYYEEFSVDPQSFLRPVKTLVRGPVLRGWDLGGNHPALITGQWSPAEGMLWYYREVEARKLVIHDFRDLGRYLCGEIPYEQLEKEERIGALRWLEKEERTGRYGVPIPWYPTGTQFVDFAGKEMNRTQSITGKTEADVFAEVGIQLQSPDEYMLHDYERIMRFLMSPHPRHKRPRMIVDPACQEFVLAMSGGLCYQRKGDTSKINKDGRADDIHDAAKYLAAGVSPIKTVAELDAMRTSDPTKTDEAITREVWQEEQEDLPSIPWGQAMQGVRWDR